MTSTLASFFFFRVEKVDLQFFPENVSNIRMENHPKIVSVSWRDRKNALGEMV